MRGMPKPLPASVLAAVLAASAVLTAQSPFRSGIDLVSFTVTAVDRTGVAVGNLTAEDFEVREDGVPQKLVYFSQGGDDSEVPLHIGLLFDTSESMEQDLSFSRSAAIRFL